MRSTGGAGGQSTADGRGSAAPHDRSAVRTARLLVAAQFVLLGALVLLPGRRDWPVPRWLDVAGLGAAAAGLGVMAVGGTTLGRGLTATPLPNRHARLRTGGLYRWTRHPIYTGLLVLAGAVTVRSGSGARLAVFVALVSLIWGKARWEEGHLRARFPEYAAYAARTPRFVPTPRRSGRPTAEGEGSSPRAEP